MACLTCTCANKRVCSLALKLCPPTPLSLHSPASTPIPLNQIKSFQTQISIIHLIQIMPCDKNYPYCNNPLNWERAAHQKEKREKGVGSEEVVVGREGGLVNQSRIRSLIPRISSLFEETFLKRTGMTGIEVN